MTLTFTPPGTSTTMPLAPSGTGGVTSPAPTPAQPTATATPVASSNNALDDLVGLYPWISQLGLTDQLRQWAAEPNISTDALIARLRQSQPYKDNMPGIFRSDGSMRMNEASYLSQRDAYRTTLEQWGRGAQEYDDPADFGAFFENDITPDDLTQRLTTYDNIVHGSSFTKSAFYVYAGMKLTDDQLYEAAVNPTAQTKLNDEYNQRVALNPLDYQTWITRATEAGLDQVSSTLSGLQQQGLVTGDAIDAVRRLDPNFAKQIADSLYHGGSASGPFLDLQSLLHSFQYALIGGAATQSGLDLPTTDRLDALRQAGVDAAKAAQGYAYISENGKELQGAMDRAHLGNQFSTEDFEKAIFLNSGPEVTALDKAQAGDKAATEAGGGGQVQQSNSGRIAQRGLQRY